MLLIHWLIPFAEVTQAIFLCVLEFPSSGSSENGSLSSATFSLWYGVASVCKHVWDTQTAFPSETKMYVLLNCIIGCIINVMPECQWIKLLNCISLQIYFWLMHTGEVWSSFWYWQNRRIFPHRYRTLFKPLYKVGYKTITELEWRCCPGFSGESCGDGSTSDPDAMMPPFKGPFPRPGVKGYPRGHPNIPFPFPGGHPDNKPIPSGFLPPETPKTSYGECRLHSSQHSCATISNLTVDTAVNVNNRVKHNK